MSAINRRQILEQAADLGEWTRTNCKNYDANLQFDPSEEVPAFDPITQGPLSSNDIVVLSDGFCYSKESIEQLVDAGVVDSDTGRTKLPLSGRMMEEADYIAVGRVAPVEGSAEMRAARERSENVSFAAFQTERTAEQEERELAARLEGLTLEERADATARYNDTDVERRAREAERQARLDTRREERMAGMSPEQRAQAIARYEEIDARRRARGDRDNEQETDARGEEEIRGNGQSNAWVEFLERTQNDPPPSLAELRERSRARYNAGRDTQSFADFVRINFQHLPRGNNYSREESREHYASEMSRLSNLWRQQAERDEMEQAGMQRNERRARWRASPYYEFYRSNFQAMPTGTYTARERADYIIRETRRIRDLWRQQIASENATTQN